MLSTLAFGDPRSAIAPALYGLGSVVGVVHLVRTKRSGVLLFSQLLMVLLLPALQQWLLGGFVASAASVLYSMNAALLAVVLVGPRAARWWFVAFAGVVALSGAVDGWPEMRPIRRGRQEKGRDCGPWNAYRGCPRCYQTAFRRA